MSKEKHIRGWVRPSIRHPAEPQRRELDAAGAVEIYVEGKETWMDFVRSLRAGDVAAVTTAARLANNRSDLRLAMADLDEAGAILLETRTGRLSDDPVERGAMLFDAVDELAQDRRAFSSDQAKAAAKKRWAGHRVQRTSDSQAMKAWGDIKTYRTNADALSSEHMVGWSLRMAYQRLGKRGTTLGGRPRKDGS